MELFTNVIVEKFCAYFISFLIVICRQLKNQVKNLKSLTEQLQEDEKDKFATEQEITKLKRQVRIFVNKDKCAPSHLYTSCYNRHLVCICADGPFTLVFVIS